MKTSNVLIFVVLITGLIRLHISGAFISFHTVEDAEASGVFTSLPRLKF